MNRKLLMTVVPGQPKELVEQGAAQICIHLFVPDEQGTFVESSVTCLDAENRLSVKSTRGRLACDPKRTVAQVTKNGVTTVVMRTGDPRAVTCPKCKASAVYADMMSQIEGAPAAQG